MNFGLLSGCMWGLDTVVLGIAFGLFPFAGSNNAAIVSAGMHDMASALLLLIYMTYKSRVTNSISAIKTKSGKVVALAALIGGPIGMLGYLMAIKNIGPGYTAIISSFFPAVGSFLAVVFLKEKMNKKQVLGLGIALVAIMLMGYSSVGTSTTGDIKLGIIGALLCVLGWGSEAVILTWGLKYGGIDDMSALQIRQTTSALAYLVIILIQPNNLSLFTSAITTPSTLYIVAAALCGTLSYLFYYKALNIIGAARGMATNITYCVFAIVFSFILLRQVPSVLEVVCSLLIMSGTLLCAAPQE